MNAREHIAQVFLDDYRETMNKALELLDILENDPTVDDIDRGYLNANYNLTVDYLVACACRAACVINVKEQTSASKRAVKYAYRAQGYLRRFHRHS
jgi:hypothetical protein